MNLLYTGCSKMDMDTTGQNYNDLTRKVTTNVSLVRESYPKWPKHSGFSGFTIKLPTYNIHSIHDIKRDSRLSRKKKKPWTLRMMNQMNKHPAFEGHPGRKMKPLTVDMGVSEK